MVSATSVLTRTTWCNVPKNIRHCHLRESIPEDSSPRPYTPLIHVRFEVFTAVTWAALSGTPLRLNSTPTISRERVGSVSVNHGSLLSAP
jgi:hypothetical protein